jgi:hypothetical protein
MNSTKNTSEETKSPVKKGLKIWLWVLLGLVALTVGIGLPLTSLMD